MVTWFSLSRDGIYTRFFDYFSYLKLCKFEQSLSATEDDTVVNVMDSYWQQFSQFEFPRQAGSVFIDKTIFVLVI